MNFAERQIIYFALTHLGGVMHICVSRLTVTGSDNGLSPGRCQAIIWTNDGILLIGPLGTNLGENLIEILTFSFTKMRLKVSSVKWRPFCLGLNALSLIWRILSAKIQHYLRLWLGTKQATGHYLNQWWPCSVTYTCIVRAQWQSEYQKNLLSHACDPIMSRPKLPHWKGRFWGNFGHLWRCAISQEKMVRLPQN